MRFFCQSITQRSNNDSKFDPMNILGRLIRIAASSLWSFREKQLIGKIFNNIQGFFCGNLFWRECDEDWRWREDIDNARGEYTKSMMHIEARNNKNHGYRRY